MATVKEKGKKLEGKKKKSEAHMENEGEGLVVVFFSFCSFSFSDLKSASVTSKLSPNDLMRVFCCWVAALPGLIGMAG